VQDASASLRFTFRGNLASATLAARVERLREHTSEPELHEYLVRARKPEARE
jgi:hypothetical protein